MPDIYINTERPIDRAIVAGINQPQREAPIGAFMAGSSYDVNLYFVKNDGTYDAASGDAGASVQVAISTLGKPQSGTFTLTDGVDTTTALEYGASALDVQTALNALNGGAGAASLTSEDSFYVFGAGTAAVNGLYVRNGSSGDGNPAYTLYDSDGTTSLYNLWSSANAVWLITSGNIGALTGLIYSVASSSATPPASGWDQSGTGDEGDLPAPSLKNAGASQVSVEKVTDQQYAITFASLGTVDALSGSTVSLYPESTPTASIAVAGSATTNAQQIIEITRQPAVYDATWSTIANGFTGTLALNTTRLLQSLLIDAGMPFYIEVKLNGGTVAKEVIGIEPSTMPASAFSATGLATLLDSFAASPASNGAFSASTWAAALKLNVYGQLYISATAQTTITTAGTFVKLAGSTASNNLNGITMPTNNRLQNNSGKTLVFQAMARTDIVDGAGNKSISIKLAKNGVVIDETESDGYTTNNIGAHCTINWILSLANGDYVEIWATNISDTSSITANHANLLLNAIDY
jgi:hypothetical protein